MIGRSRFSRPSVTVFAAFMAYLLGFASGANGQELASVTPDEDTKAVLHNPDMGWVLYENYPLDQDPHGSSTLLTLPDETFVGVDYVALMFSWADVEKEEGRYDFSKVNFAYDFWRKRGKEIQLRVSAESLLWWANRTPPSGHGIPEYVLSRVPDTQRQTRTESGIAYTVVDARNPFYRERLSKFLEAVKANFDPTHRPVTLVDLRGFGLWGEWHTGYRYFSVEERHDALRSILDIWSAALPDHYLSLSYSYDPDSPKEYFAGPRDRFDPAFTASYNDFLHYSAFDHALTKANITFRRDGCGGAVHSNERLLCETAFVTLSKGPFMSEFLGGYSQAKKGGEKWIHWMIEDALSLHPNYVCLLGWQGGDARDFLKEQPELVAHGLRTMGYRFVPTKVSYPQTVKVNQAFEVESHWVNRAVGRALRDYQLEFRIRDADGKVVALENAGSVPTSRWVRGTEYTARNTVRFPKVEAGEYELEVRMIDGSEKRVIRLPVVDADAEAFFKLGSLRLAPVGS